MASRTVNASLYNMFVQASNVVASQIYRADGAPRCKFLNISLAILILTAYPSDVRGNRILIIISCVNLLVLYPGTKAYYIWRNRQRATIWDAMTGEVCARSACSREKTHVEK